MKISRDALDRYAERQERWRSADRLLYPAREVEMAEIEIRSELAGIVRKIEVPAGGRIEVDGALLILECMKMEIPVLVPQGGKVKTLLVEEGAVVEEGQKLAVLER
jgi:acetyl-CoA carboxylase biotin carboxyl carrier protein